MAPGFNRRRVKVIVRIKSHRLTLLFLIVLFAAWQSAVPLGRAQVNEKEKAEKEIEKRRELEQKTFTLLDEVINGGWGLKLAENRAFIFTSAAGLLWSRDEKRARNLFWEALNNLNLPATGDQPKVEPAKESANQDQDTTAARKPAQKAPSKEQMQALSRHYEIYGKRSAFLRQVALRDPELALDMLRATRQPPPPAVDGYVMIATEADLEKEIAAASARLDPHRALEIARQSLAKGLSFQLLNLLNELTQQNEEVATEFATDIMAKLNPDNVGRDFEAALLASVLLSQSRDIKVPAGEKITYKQLRLSEEQKSSLVNLIADVTLSATVSANILQNFRSVMPEIEQYAPDRAARVKAKIDSSNRLLSKDEQEWNRLGSLYETASAEQMIKAADKVNDEQRGALYRDAVTLATMRGRADSLREYINGQIEDDSRRKTLLDLLDAEQVYAAVYRGKAEELQKLLPLIRLKEQRAMALAELAMLLEKQGAHDEAVKLLDEARGLVKVDLTSEKQSNALLAVMLGYALVDADKAFQMIEPVIDRVNSDLSRLLLLDKIARTGATKNGEMLMQQPNISLEFGILKYAPGLVALAKADFNRTKLLADRFERSELRLMARLMLVQALLQKDQQTVAAK